MNIESQILVTLAEIKGRLDAIEHAREVAKEANEEWKDEIRGELREIKGKQDLTNGRVGKLELWKARTDGFSAAFRWWPATVAGVIGAAAVAALTHFN